MLDSLSELHSLSLATLLELQLIGLFPGDFPTHHTALREETESLHISPAQSTACGACGWKHGKGETLTQDQC